MTKKINLKKLDKTNCQKLRFDEIAKSITERVDPNNTELKIYIGLEHLDPESIHIKRNGTRDDVKGQKLKCYPGDVIFGKRRAYQRKAAIVTQEGFCSAHSMVLRANPEVIEPKLFPFFLHSDQFMNRAIDISVGSLSPTINWGTLKKQEFLLPPKEQQAKLAELLWAMDEVIEKALEILKKLEKYKKSFDKKKFELYRTSHKEIGAHTQKIGSGVTPKGGSKVYQKTGIKFIRSQNILSGVFNYDDVAYISEEIDNKMASSRVKKHDVLLNITGASIGRCAIYSDNERANVNQHVCIIRTNKNELDPVFLSEFINSRYGQVQIQILQAGGNREGLNFANIRMIKIPNYTLEKQLQIKHDYLLIRENMKKISNKILTSKSLQKSLINEVF